MDRTACTESQCLYSRAIPLPPLWTVQPVQSLSACTVELYLYSPYGPYSLYRASVPVQGCAVSTLCVCKEFFLWETNVDWISGKKALEIYGKRKTKWQMEYDWRNSRFINFNLFFDISWWSAKNVVHVARMGTVEFSLGKKLHSNDLKIKRHLGDLKIDVNLQLTQLFTLPLLRIFRVVTEKH